MLMIFVFYSPILIFVLLLPPSGIHDFIICCKGCGANVPAPVEPMPSSSIVAVERRKQDFVPAEKFGGKRAA